MSKLSDEIISLVEASGANESQQRSALGMARSWADGHELKLAANSLDLKPKRDQLAKDVVALMTNEERDDCIAALHDARERMDAPYADETMLGFRAGRQRLGKPGEKKKARE